jgi:glycosyltransferase involved in cell wall biosynthesis
VRSVSGPWFDVVYRGPFQGRRISFLLDALAQLGGTQRFIWLHPGKDWRESSAFLPDFMAERAAKVESTVLDGRPQGLPAALRVLADPRRPRAALALAIGFTSLPFGRVVRAGRLVWCVNGIPEERLLHRDDSRQQLAVQALWRTARVGRSPDAAITVSEPMAELVQERVATAQTFVAPTVVDRSTFRPRAPGPGELTYVGSAAPWQDLPLLAEIWSALHRRDPDLRFRVVSKDARADVLCRALPPAVVESGSAADPAAVAEQLRATQLGFIVRRPHPVNAVSYPTKFGEYVASGVGVVTTDIGWDIGRLVRSTGCGLVLDVDDSPARMADDVVGFIHGPGAAADVLSDACDTAASALDRSRYVKELGAFLGGLVA